MFRSEKKRMDSNLDSVFNRLQVSTVCKEGITGNLPASVNGHIPAIDGPDVRLNQAIGRKLNLKRRKKSNKRVLKKAKLILPKTFSLKQNQGSKSHTNDSSDSSEDDEDCIVEEDEVFVDDTSHTSVSTAPVSCSTQYLQQGANGQSSGNHADTVDSSPDELASYFEQILFIPKPMSLMAQMMYA